MLKSELLNNGEFIRHYSDNNKMIIQKETGILYEEAVDIYPCPYIYEETEQEVQEEPPANN